MKLLKNGTIYLGRKKPFEEAILIDGKKIYYTGNNEEAERLAGATADVIDLNGQLVLPGFCDSHAHGAQSQTMKMETCDLSQCKSVEAYLKTVENYIKEHPEKTIIQGIGWENPLFDDKGPKKELLDSISKTRAIFLKSTDYHSIWANSKAIEMAGITERTPDPKGGTIERNSDGTISGTFREEAQNPFEAIRPLPDVAVCKKAILKYQETMASYGITNTFDPLLDPREPYYKAYRELAEEGRLFIKVGIAYTSYPENPMPALDVYATQPRGNKDKLYEGTYVKIFIDGVVEGTTALLKEPYSHIPNYCGEALWKDEALKEFCAAVDKMGFDIHFHTIGDAAVSQMLDALEYVQRVNPTRERRPVAAHVQLMDPADVSRAKAVNLSISADPYWFFKAPGYFEDIEEPFLGKERAAREYPMKIFFDHGIVVSSASDYSVTPEPRPLMGIKNAVERCWPGDDPQNRELVLNPAQRVSLEDMIDSFTIHGAWTTRTEAITGSIETGKFADLVVLDRNILEMTSEDLLDTQIVMTISEGDVIYRKEK